MQRARAANVASHLCMALVAVVLTTTIQGL